MHNIIPLIYTGTTHLLGAIIAVVPSYNDQASQRAAVIRKHLFKCSPYSQQQIRVYRLPEKDIANAFGHLHWQ